MSSDVTACPDCGSKFYFQVTEDAEVEHDGRKLTLCMDVHMKCFGCGGFFYTPAQAVNLGRRLRAGEKWFRRD